MRKSSKIAAAFRSRAFRSGSYTLAAAVLAVAAVLLINLFIGALPDNLTHLDTTSNSVYLVTSSLTIPSLVTSSLTTDDCSSF